MKPVRRFNPAEKADAHPRFGASIHHVASCTSSMDVARRLERDGAAEGTVVVCAEQTRGRGRSGHSWFSPHDKGLYVSVILRPERSDLTLLSLAAGLAVCEALQAHSRARIQIKWPNDVTAEGRKLAGILCESVFQGERVSRVILGIGLNLSHKPQDFPPELRDHAVSLRTLSGGAEDIDVLLDSVITSLWKWYGKFSSRNDDVILSAYSEQAVFRQGETVRVVTGENVYLGAYGGVDPQGGLILLTRDERRVFYEASVRPVHPEEGGTRC